jgi:two-component system response regulator CpxR
MLGSPLLVIKKTCCVSEILIGSVSINANFREVYCEDKVVALTGLEFNLLWLLMSCSPQLVSRELIANRIFNCGVNTCNKSIDIHISSIRKKLSLSKRSCLLRTLRGQGYVFLHDEG